MHLRLARCAFLAVVVCALSPSLAQADGVPLGGDAIKRLVTGKRVLLAIPLGGEFPLRYDASGIVAGSGEAAGLARFMAPTDSGKWWVVDNRLCQQWTSWYDGKPFCFTINQTRPAAIEWRRDDGYSGTARIGN